MLGFFYSFQLTLNFVGIPTVVSHCQVLKNSDKALHKCNYKLVLIAIAVASRLNKNLQAVVSY